MKVKMKPIPEDLKQNLHKIPYLKRRKFSLLKISPVFLIVLIIIFLLILNNSKSEQINYYYYEELNYVGPKEGEVLAPDEFSIISKEPIEVYINSKFIEPKVENNFYIYEETLKEGEYRLEIIKDNERKEIKFYVVDNSSS
ncbi:MAG: hypothetical protein ABIL76_01000 [candidate division WOR-3 bacterium]